MKSLISINYKFMDINPKKLVELVLESKYTKGFEVCINISDDKQVKYLDDLVFYIKNNDLILQIHGIIDEDYMTQLIFIKKLEHYSDILGYPIVLTLHTIYDENKDVSINKTIEYISNLLNEINNNKIIISLENLNDTNKLDRLNKEDIKTTILNDEKIYFTYDIGHEIADYGNVTKLDKYMIEDIRNIHIHSYDKEGNDHMPIYKNDMNWDKILKSLIFLKVNNYKYNIVYEYGLEYCNGETKEEKIKDYLSSIDYVSQHY